MAQRNRQHISTCSPSDHSCRHQRLHRQLRGHEAEGGGGATHEDQEQPQGEEDRLQLPAQGPHAVSDPMKRLYRRGAAFCHKQKNELIYRNLFILFIKLHLTPKLVSYPVSFAYKRAKKRKDYIFRGVGSAHVKLKRCEARMVGQGVWKLCPGDDLKNNSSMLSY